MEKLIQYLREQANNGIAGVPLSNAEALQIADALEAATFPPMARAALALLEVYKYQQEWATISLTGVLKAHYQKPVYLHGGGWSCRGVSIPAFNFKVVDMNTAETLLFHRTATGWEWVGNPNNQTPEKP